MRLGRFPGRARAGGFEAPVADPRSSGRASRCTVVVTGDGFTHDVRRQHQIQRHSGGVGRDRWRRSGIEDRGCACGVLATSSLFRRSPSVVTDSGTRARPARIRRSPIPRAQPVHLRDCDATVADSFRATLATKVDGSPRDAFNKPCIVPFQMCRFLQACGAWSEDCGGNDACVVSGARRRVSGSIVKAERAVLEDSQASVVLAQQSSQVRQANFTDLLDAQRLYQQARLGIARAECNRFRDIALPFVALGGDAPH